MNGCLFVAGYHIADMGARDSMSNLILLYDHAPFCLIHCLVQGWLGFAADPLTGLTYLDNYASAHLASITAKVPADEILQVLEK